MSVGDVIDVRRASGGWIVLLGLLSCPMPVRSAAPADSIDDSRQSAAGDAGAVREAPWPVAMELTAPDFAGSSANRGKRSASVEARSLAAADLDSDGIRDLLVGYRVGDGGAVALYRGSVGAIYPHSPRARALRAAGVDADRPFLTPPKVFELEQPADVLASGDFDGDGVWDVAAAGLGRDRLWLLRGDGRGRLEPAVARRLPGVLTALASGELHRRDGLADLAVGIDGEEGPRLLLLRSELGAFLAHAEVVPLPAAATSLALGDVDGDAVPDVTAAAGEALVVVSGRPLPAGAAAARAPLPPLAVRRIVFDERVEQVALADLVEEPGRRSRREAVVLLEDGTLQRVRRLDGRRADPALESARLPWTAARILSPLRHRGSWGSLVLASASGRLTVLSADPGQGLRETGGSSLGDGAIVALAMRLNSDALDDLVLLHEGSAAPSVLRTKADNVFTVDSDEDDGDFDVGDGVCCIVSTGTIGTCPIVIGGGPGNCTLRAAIEEANHDPSSDEIRFGLPSDHLVIAPTTPLPPIVTSLTIDGTTQPGYDGAPVVELDGSNLEFPESLLEVSAALGVLRGLVLRDTAAAVAVTVTTNGDATIEGCFIGTDASGSQPAPNGVGVRGVSGLATIGGPAEEATNVISGNGSLGIVAEPTARIVVHGNLIGTDLTGTLPLGGQRGIAFNSGRGQIGGTQPGSGNLISGNGSWGIEVRNSESALIQGNWIGTDASGLGALGNSASGIIVWTSRGVLVGGTTIAARNLIASNGETGISIRTSRDTRVQGNWIGVDASGQAALANQQSGIFATFLADSSLGGSVQAAGNVISGNVEWGLRVSSSSDLLIGGNRIGTDASGALAVPNQLGGARIENTGAVVLDRNLVGGNTGPGLVLANGSSGNTVQSNLIGLDAAGARALPNGGDGVLLDESADNLLGGIWPGTGNVISANGGNGLSLLSSGTTGNRVVGNTIGLDVEGTVDLGNGGEGISLVNGPAQNRIGGGLNEGNAIAYNAGAGVGLAANAGVSNSILGNSIHDNQSLGIDLGSNGVTANDPGDGDMGPNGLQNFPTLSYAHRVLETVTVGGQIDGAPGTAYRIELFRNETCDPSMHGEAQLQIAVFDVLTDGSGVGTFAHRVSEAPPLGEYVTASATDPDANTSELSQCRLIEVPPGLVFADGLESGDTSAWGSSG